MSSESAKEFEEFARDCVRLAEQADTPELREKLLNLAEWALERGLLNEFHRMIEEMRKLDANHPIVKTVPKTVDAMRDALKVQPNGDDPAAASLIAELTRDEYKTIHSDQGHYTLLTNVKDAKRDAGVKRRLARMEETYQGFFYWFALKGKPRPVPPYRLVAALVKAQSPVLVAGCVLVARHSPSCVRSI